MYFNMDTKQYNVRNIAASCLRSMYFNMDTKQMISVLRQKYRLRSMYFNMDTKQKNHRALGDDGLRSV